MAFSIWIKVIILGIIEGLTEFLPVSSTGHLLVLGRWLRFESEVFDVFIQMGALLAVWWLYRQRLFRMIPWGKQSSLEGRRLGFQVLLAFLPVFIIGLPVHRWIQEHLFSVQAIAWASIGGGIVILLVEGFKPQVKVPSIEALPFRLALIVGIGQCLSLYPGISRSGATIMTGLLFGLGRSVATEFTFLLAVPTMSAATLYELWKYRHALSIPMMELLILGFVVSYGTAFLVVKWFVRFVQSHTFEGFAWYRIVAGALLLGLLSKGFFDR